MRTTRQRKRADQLGNSLAGLSRTLRMSENGRDSAGLRPARFWCIWPAQRLVPCGSRVAPPAGFEPAHTAPESIAQDRSHQPGRSLLPDARAARGGDPAGRPPLGAVAQLRDETPPGHLQPLLMTSGARAPGEPSARDYAFHRPLGVDFRAEFPVSVEAIPRALNLAPVPRDGGGKRDTRSCVQAGVAPGRCEAAR